MNQDTSSLPVVVAGGGIGGPAAALALRGFAVKVLRQSPRLGEIVAGIQLGANAVAAFDALGIGDRTRAMGVYNDEMVMHEAIDESLVGRIPKDDAFRQRFANPYAAIQRADVHPSLLEGAQACARFEVLTGTAVANVEQDTAGVTVIDGCGVRHCAQALIGADGVASAVRQQCVGDKEESSMCEGSRGQVLSYFEGISPKARQLIELPKDSQHWATADREPIDQWIHGHTALFGHTSHPTLQYREQGACMALDDAVRLGVALCVHDDDVASAAAHYQRSRVARTARVELSSREFGHDDHAKSVERLVRNQRWTGRTCERFYDAMAWPYSRNVRNCLAA